jgi:hypothetical protein
MSKSVDALLPEDQQLCPGDLVRFGKPGSPAYSVVSLDPHRSLVLVEAVGSSWSDACCSGSRTELSGRTHWGTSQRWANTGMSLCALRFQQP